MHLNESDSDVSARLRLTDSAIESLSGDSHTLPAGLTCGSGKATGMNLLISFAEEARVSPFPSPDSDTVWRTTEATLPSSSSVSAMRFDQLGLFGKMSQESSAPQIMPSGASSPPWWEQTPPSSRHLTADGGVTRVWLLDHREPQRGVASMLNISASPSDASACSLSQVLQQNVSAKYYLSSIAAAGILRRAKKRGRELPDALRMALEAVATATILVEKST